MLQCKLPRERVEIADALYGDQKRFISVEPGIDQFANLFSRVVFQFCDVNAVNRLASVQVTPPEIDLALEQCLVPGCMHYSAPWRSCRPDAGNENDCQMPRSVSSTVCHCLRSSASCACP